MAPSSRSRRPGSRQWSIRSVAVTTAGFHFAGLIQVPTAISMERLYPAARLAMAPSSKLRTAGIEVVLYSFSGGNDGGSPFAGLILAADGNFYGTTGSGGIASSGTIFKITPAGVETALYSFGGGNDGANPFAGLIQGVDGKFYGTTEFGGPSNLGTVFQILKRRGKAYSPLSGSRATSLVATNSPYLCGGSLCPPRPRPRTDRSARFQPGPDRSRVRRKRILSPARCPYTPNGSQDVQTWRSAEYCASPYLPQSPPFQRLAAQDSHAR